MTLLRDGTELNLAGRVLAFTVPGFKIEPKAYGDANELGEPCATLESDTTRISSSTGTTARGHAVSIVSINGKDVFERDEYRLAAGRHLIVVNEKFQRRIRKPRFRRAELILDVKCGDAYVVSAVINPEATDRESYWSLHVENEAATSKKEP